MNFNGNQGNLVFTKAYGLAGVAGIMGDVDSKKKWALITISTTGLHFAKFINNPLMDLNRDGSLKVIGFDIT